MSTRPHLVLDGAELAAEAVGAERIVLYVGEDHVAARAALGPGDPRARPGASTTAFRLVALRRRATSPARSPRPSTSSTPGTPARRRCRRARSSGASTVGRRWSRTSRASPTPRSSRATATTGTARPAAARPAGTALVTIGREPGRGGHGDRDRRDDRGGRRATSGRPRARCRPVLLGGYFGGWVDGTAAWSRPTRPGRRCGSRAPRSGAA